MLDPRAESSRRLGMRIDGRHRDHGRRARRGGRVQANPGRREKHHAQTIGRDLGHCGPRGCRGARGKRSGGEREHSNTPTFSYSGDNGPGFWGQLDPAWEACAGGSGRQSPIDITNVQIDPRLKALDITLKPTPISLINNGHTIEQEYEPGSTLTIDGETYRLQQFHLGAGRL